MLIVEDLGPITSLAPKSENIALIYLFQEELNLDSVYYTHKDMNGS